MEGLVACLLPEGISACAAQGDDERDDLYAEEREAVRRASDGRRREFATGRRCARAALESLGIAPVPLPRMRSGAVAWPQDIVGSISHCTGFRVAIAASGKIWLGIGVDVEPRRQLPEGVLDFIAAPGEVALLSRMATLANETEWELLLFCTKEAVLKAVMPWAGQSIDFKDIHIALDAQAQSFEAQIPGLPADDAIRVRKGQGSWRASGHFILAAFWISRQERPRPSRQVLGRSCADGSV